MNTNKDSLIPPSETLEEETPCLECGQFHGDRQCIVVLMEAAEHLRDIQQNR